MGAGLCQTHLVGKAVDHHVEKATHAKSNDTRQNVGDDQIIIIHGILLKAYLRS